MALLLLFSHWVVSSSLRPQEWQHTRLPCPSLISRSLLKLMSIEFAMPSIHLILCHPLLLLPSIFPSIRVFSNELALCIRWPKYWSFSFIIRSSSEYSGLISFRFFGRNFHLIYSNLSLNLNSVFKNICFSECPSCLPHSMYYSVKNGLWFLLPFYF